MKIKTDETGNLCICYDKEFQLSVNLRTRQCNIRKKPRRGKHLSSKNEVD